MAQYRMQVTTETAADLTAENHVVNTFYLDTDALSGADDPEALCVDAAAAWTTFLQFPAPFDRVRVRAYDMSDTPPRVPVAEAIDTMIPGGAAGPREVALCLSYYAGQNVPRRRGRMYIGPWQESVMAERPTGPTQLRLQDLAGAISGLGGINVQWVQYSPTTGDFTNVSHWWVDNEWDTVRSRGLSGTARIEGDVSG